MIQRLGAAVPDLGREHRRRRHRLSRAAQARRGGRSRKIDEGLPQATGGRKEYKDDDGKVTKVVEWFGFKLHLLVDVKHEVVLSYEITDTKAGDGETLPAILAQAQGEPARGPDRDPGLRQGGRQQRGARAALRRKASSR